MWCKVIIVSALSQRKRAERERERERELDNNHECKSSEEMRASLEKYNCEKSDDEKKDNVIFSMDAKQLYPSMRIESCMRTVKELILKSDI